MIINFAGEAQDVFERAVASLPQGYTIGVVTAGAEYVEGSGIVPGQDVELVDVLGGALIVRDIDPNTLEPRPDSPHRRIDLRDVEELHVY